MAWKHEHIFLKCHRNLNISEILQGVLHVNVILELLLKYDFHRWAQACHDVVDFTPIKKQMFQLRKPGYYR